MSKTNLPEIHVRDKSMSLLELLKAANRLAWYAFRKLPFLAISFFILVSLSFIYPFINRYLEKLLIDGLVGFGEVGTNVNTILLFLILYIGGREISNISGEVRNYIHRILNTRINEIITLDVLAKVSSLDLYFFEDPAGNDLLQRVLQKYTHQSGNFLSRSAYLLGSFIGIVTAVTILVSFSPMVVVVIFLSLIPYLIVDLQYSKRVWGIWQSDVEMRRRFYDTMNYLEDAERLQEVKVFGIRKFLLRVLDKLFKDFNAKEMQEDKRRTVLMIASYSIGAIGFAYPGWLLAQSVMGGVITIGTFTFYIGAIQRLYTDIAGLFNRISQLYENSLFTQDLFTLLDTEPHIQSGSKKLEEKSVAIEFKNVWFRYPNTKRYIFKNLDLTIPPGQNLAIVGENGAGKTTLIKLLLRFYDVDKGEILINGVNIKELRLDDLYTKFSYLSQNFTRYHFDVKTNIAIGNIRKIHDRKRVYWAARKAHASQFIRKYPEKYNQVLSKRYEGGTQPSAGQWQKIALARAFFKDSPVLVLDEPTSAIDPRSEYDIFNEIFNFAKNKTVFIISHRFSTVRFADRIIVVDGGEVVEDGTHRRLMQNAGLYKAAYEVQKKGFED